MDQPQHVGEVTEKKLGFGFGSQNLELRNVGNSSENLVLTPTCGSNFRRRVLDTAADGDVTSTDLAVVPVWWE